MLLRNSFSKQMEKIHDGKEMIKETTQQRNDAKNDDGIFKKSFQRSCYGDVVLELGTIVL